MSCCIVFISMRRSPGWPTLEDKLDSRRLIPITLNILKFLPPNHYRVTRNVCRYLPGLSAKIEWCHPILPTV